MSIQTMPGPSLEEVTAQNLHITLPFPGPLDKNTNRSRFLSGFSSRLVAGINPFLPQSPFTPFDSINVEIVRILSNEYAETKTDFRASVYEHLSGSLGVGVGRSWCGIMVSAGYDRAVLENTDATKLSRRARVRLSCVLMGRPPALSVEAKELIAQGAYDDFTTRYGDYFVGGYVIGAEAAAMVSRRDASKETEETFSATVTTTFFFWSVSATAVVASSRDVTKTCHLRVDCMDTLDGVAGSFSPGEHTIGDVDNKLKPVLKNMEDLQTILIQRFEALKPTEVESPIWHEGGVCALNMRELASLERAGVVYEMILIPFSSLRDCVALRPWTST